MRMTSNQKQYSIDLHLRSYTKLNRINTKKDKLIKLLDKENIVVTIN